MARKGVVLAYHGIADVDPRDDPLRLWVSPASFERQVRTMQRRDYAFVTMAEFGERLHAGSGVDGLCALTFDDGTEDHATVLPGLLQRLGVPGTVYVCPGLLGQPYPWVDQRTGIRFMTETQLRDIASDGHIEIGSHTENHTELDTATEEFALAEMIRCKDTLEDMLGVEIPSFCYPRCHYSASAPAAARKAGYRTAVVCGPRGSWNPYELKRESIHTPDGPLTFAFKSRGLYYRSRDLPVVRAARAVTRPFRHFRELIPRRDPQ